MNLTLKDGRRAEVVEADMERGCVWVFVEGDADRKLWIRELGARSDVLKKSLDSQERLLQWVLEDSPLDLQRGSLLRDDVEESLVALRAAVSGVRASELPRKDGWVEGTEVQCGFCQSIKTMGNGCDREDCPCSKEKCGHG